MGILKLGIAPIGWRNDDLPELGAGTDVSQILGESKQAGYTGTERGSQYPANPQEFRALLNDYGMTLASGWFSGELLTHNPVEEFDRMGEHIDVLLTCGSEVCVYAETSNTIQTDRSKPLSERPRIEGDALKRYGENLTALAEKMQAAGLPMSYHHHMGTIIETEDDVDGLMSATDKAVGLLFDTGHLTFAGCRDICAVAKRYAPRINHIHLKDIREGVMQDVLNKGQSFLDGVLDGVFTVPGDGMIDFQAVAQLVADIDYSGWLVVEAEQDPAKANPLDYAIMGYEHTMTCLTKAGLKIG